jgi:hypothetical protein
MPEKHLDCELMEAVAQVPILDATVTHLVMMTFAYAREALTDELMEAVAPIANS